MEVCILQQVQTIPSHSKAQRSILPVLVLNQRSIPPLHSMGVLSISSLLLLPLSYSAVSGGGHSVHMRKLSLLTTGCPHWIQIQLNNNQSFSISSHPQVQLSTSPQAVIHQLALQLVTIHPDAVQLMCRVRQSTIPSLIHPM